MSDPAPQIVESCPACQQVIDVTGEAPFSEVACPSCGAVMRARVHFNNFTLLELLGEGGMGSVFRARDNNLNREVALKILKREAGSTEADWAKLAEEARLTASINHPNVVKVFSFGEDHGQFYLAMELVEKSSLDRLMTLQSKIAEAQVLDVGIQIAEGLQAAYEHGLIHRDIKPGNILFASANLAKIVDFGLARVLDEEAQESGEIWGTPFYVAPEKLDGRPEDFRSDIYSLGGTLFHALAGRPPFDAKTASMVVLKHIKNQPVSLQAFAPNISDETAYVINRMLHKDPDQRYGSYEELLNHLQYARHRLMERAAVQEPKKHARRAQRRGVTIGAIWATALALCCAVGWAFFIPPGRNEDSGLSKDSAETARMAEARRAMADGKHGEAAVAFAAIAASAPQPQANWALAQQAAADWLAGKPDAAREVMGRLAAQGFYSYDLRDQPLGRFFADLGSGKVEDVGEGSDFRVFGLLVSGLEKWSGGDLDDAVRDFQQFFEGRPSGGDEWIADLKPVVAPYLADHAAYVRLRDRVSEADGSAGADLLLEIDQAKRDARTGDVVAAKLEALKGGVRLE
jgi:Serine/threonine protein kinase